MALQEHAPVIGDVRPFDPRDLLERRANEKGSNLVLVQERDVATQEGSRLRRDKRASAKETEVGVGRLGVAEDALVGGKEELVNLEPKFDRQMQEPRRHARGTSERGGVNGGGKEVGWPEGGMWERSGGTSKKPYMAC